jgi:hypothetical protein
MDLGLTTQDADDSTVEGTSSIEEEEEQEWQENSLLTEAPLCAQETPSEPSLPRSDWWTEADTVAGDGFRGITSISKLLSAQVVPHVRGMPAHHEELYWQLGARKPDGHYVAVSLGVGNNSLVFVSEIADRNVLDKCLAGNFLKERLKLIINPVKVKIPFPSKGPENADTIGTFFGGHANSSCRSKLPCGAQVVSVYVDIFSKWLVKVAFKQCGFKLGNVVEISLVDWQNRAALASIRVLVTEDFLQLTA